MQLRNKLGIRNEFGIRDEIYRLFREKGIENLHQELLLDCEYLDGLTLEKLHNQTM
ncbi:MAG: hypothetical protein F6K25_30180 [Okeania sp. SIO2G4]|uniref:hypothetical protein n=1 Tax=unclassified Okeania TaxID=2634635 RepID=UPI0013B7A43E|nr:MULTISPECIES: hypothetical protein [unclassified Okeania]NEP03832.1 hypothetical protein [Okeania sp. SIO4D6]NEP41784.1 hypothetical protein [Okeania sp. SIO2H7]NEP75848.1 hypothetical protein [Okeania sp. SIO2G5]NEP96553.1 hypothetical protein [Okeania sp. SIO2F5]NEQ75260.1 hypothetical protein [Okeania sp. SIO2C9]